MATSNPAITPDEDNTTSTVAESVVLNLSELSLTPPMLSVLNKGLSFCPSTPHIDHSQVMSGVDHLLRQMRRTAFFNRLSDLDPHTSNWFVNTSQPDPESKPFDHHKFKEPSSFDPKSDNQTVLNHFCKTVLHDTYTSPIRPFRGYNLTKDERSALNQLQSNPEIVIKPADKGGKIVIQDTPTYIAEAKKHLSNPKAYRQLNTDQTELHNQQVKQLIDELLTREAISPNVANFLVFNRPRTPQLYMLPKIHKPTRPPPGRPIVSANRCPTERISGLVDHFLRPYVKDLPSFIKDTPDLIRKIESIPNIPPDTLLVTLDVVSLYTNIPCIEALKVAKATLTHNRDDTDEPLKNNDIVRMLALVLRCNNFDFNGEHFLQIQGVAMGTKAAPTIANLVMGDFEHKYVYPYRLQPLLWVRFIDDNLMLWTHGPTALGQFVDHLNAVHPTIKFTYEHSKVSIPMLDTRIISDPNGHLYTTLYNKPTDTHPYLHFSSCHPHHKKTGGPYSQLLRVRRICQKDHDFESNAKLILDYYRNRSYPEQTLQDAWERVKSIPRPTLLTIKEVEEPPPEAPLVCITTYHPQNPPLKDILQKNWPTLSIDPKLQGLSNRRLVFGHKRMDNLRDILVHSKIQYPPPVKPTVTTVTVNPTKICNNTNCRYCPKLDLSGSITSTTTMKRYIVPQRITCKFNNLVYCITCKVCKSQYVGQTGNSIQFRFQKHLKDVEHCSDWSNAPPSAHTQGRTNVGLHFSATGHKVTDIQINVLELINRDPKSPDTVTWREARETFWMHKLKSLKPFGINATDGSNHVRSRPNRSQKDHTHRASQT